MGKAGHRSHKSKRTAKQTTTNKELGDTINDGIPRTLVFGRGLISGAAKDLIDDIKKSFMPHTYDSLKVKKSNCIKDFLAVSNALGLSHLVIFSSAGKGTNMRIIKVPHGPTLHFRLVEYSANLDIQKNIKDPSLLDRNSACNPKLYERPPLCILSGFNRDIKENEEENEKFRKGISLAAVTFKGMFPSVDVSTAKAKNIQRAILFAVDEKGYINVRHYAIQIGDNMVDKPGSEVVALTKRILKGSNIDLSNLKELSDMAKMETNVAMSQTNNNSNDDNASAACDKTSFIELKEIGPRFTLELVKVEMGVNTGAVIYHSRIEKSIAQIKFLEQNSQKAKAKIERKEKEDYKKSLDKLRDEKMEYKRKEKRKEKFQSELETRALMKEAEMDEKFDTRNEDAKLEKERLKEQEMKSKNKK